MKRAPPYRCRIYADIYHYGSPREDCLDAAAATPRHLIPDGASIGRDSSYG